MNNHLAITTITCLLAWMLTACSGEELSSPSAATGGPCTYTLRLEGSCQGFDDATRAAVVWQDGDVVYLYLTDEAGKVNGQAVYQSEKKAWIIETNRPILSISGNGEARYFENPVEMNANKVILSANSVIYADDKLSYEKESENELIVKTHLTPQTGRIRFRGQIGEKRSLSGLSFYNSYSVSSRDFTRKEEAIVPVIGESGFSEYYYMLLNDDRTVIWDHNATSCFLSTFDEGILAVGTSGYVTIPTLENPSYWILANKQNMQPITLPEVGQTTMKQIRSRSAKICASLTSEGNGTLASIGFIYSIYPNPTTENGKTVEATLTDGQLEGHISGLTPETRYYVCAYAANEKGMTLGAPQMFFTISLAEDGTTIGNGEYGDDENMDDADSTEGNIDRNDYEEDEELDDKDNAGMESSEGDLKKNGYDEDEEME